MSMPFLFINALPWMIFALPLILPVILVYRTPLQEGESKTFWIWINLIFHWFGFVGYILLAKRK